MFAGRTQAPKPQAEPAAGKSAKTRQTQANPRSNPLWASLALRAQPKLEVGAADDLYEREADAMAERVMRMPAGPRVQRQCANCQPEDEMARRKPLAATPVQAKSEGGTQASPALGQAIASTRGGGSGLDGATHAFMGQRFGTDFSAVRVHTGDAAERMNQTLDARAFTVGRDIYFGEGQYRPQSQEGKTLLAHELAHTLQQQGADGARLQRATKNQRCLVHAYDNSDPKDKAVVYERSGWDKFLGNDYPNVFGVLSVDNLVAKTNAYLSAKDNDCSCVGRLEINGHGTDGYQSVGNGVNYVNDDKALVHDSTQENLEKLKGIKFCDRGILMLLGCHVGQGKGKTLVKRISNIVPGVLVGGAEHFTFGTGAGGKKVVTDDADVNAKNEVDDDKGTEFLKSKNVRWYFTDKDGKEYTSGSDLAPAELKMKVKTADKVKVVTPEGEQIKIK